MSIGDNHEVVTIIIKKKIKIWARTWGMIRFSDHKLHYAMAL